MWKMIGFAFVAFLCTTAGAQGPLQQDTKLEAQGPPPTITLRDAIAKATANSPAFRQALVNYGVAAEAALQARDALLPSVTYNNQYLYTEGNGTLSGVFIANNAVHEYISEAFRHTLETGEPYETPERVEYRIDRKETEYSEWRVDRIQLPEGGYRVVCYFRDISERVKARIALQEQEERLKKTEKMAAAGQLAASLAHEINNPLSSVTNALYLLKTDPGS